jgi:hypothetical protein
VTVKQTPDGHNLQDNPPTASLTPAGDQWRYELKLDGYRAIAIKTASGVKLISRNEKDLSGDYPELVKAVRQLPFTQASPFDSSYRVNRKLGDSVSFYSRRKS